MWSEFLPSRCLEMYVYFRHFVQDFSKQMIALNRIRSLTFHRVIVFISGYILFGLSMGLAFSLGAIFPIIMDTFNSTRAETSLIQTIYSVCAQGGGIVWGTIVSKFGPQKTTLVGSMLTSLALIVSFWTTSFRYLIVTSVFGACGVGMCFVSCTVGVRKFFVGKSNNVALALMSSSSGSTAVAFTYILPYLSIMYGLRGMLLIVGGLELHGAVLSLLWKQHYIEKDRMSSSDTHSKDSSNTESISNTYDEQTGYQSVFVIDRQIYSKGRNCKGRHGFTTAEIIESKSANIRHENERIKGKEILSLKSKLKHLLTNKSYIFTVIAMICCLNSLMQYMIFVVDMYEDHGFSRLQGSNGLTIINIAAIFGRASPALIAKCKFYNPFLLPVFSNALASLAMYLFTVVNSVALYNILVGFFGLGFGVCASVMVVSVSELVEPQYLAESVGLLMTVNGVCAVFRSIVTGHLRDLTGSYTLSQILTSVFTALGSVLFIVAACFQKKKTRNIEENRRPSIFYVTKL